MENDTLIVDSSGNRLEQKVDREAFERVARQLEAGDDLTLEMVGDVFLKEFWMMLVMCFMDSGDAARAIQNAIARLSGGTKAKRVKKNG